MNGAKLEGIIQSALKKLKGVEAVVLVTPDGFPISSNMDPDKSERISAMGASFVSLAKRVAEDMRHGKLKKVVVHTDRGKVVCVPLEDGTSMILLVE